MSQTAPENGIKREAERELSSLNGRGLYAAAEIESWGRAAESAAVPGGQKNSCADGGHILTRDESDRENSGENKDRGLFRKGVCCESSISEAGNRSNADDHCFMRSDSCAVSAFVARVKRGVKDFFNLPLLRSEKEIFSDEKLGTTQGQKNHSPKNFSPAVKFSLQENESDYKVIRDNPKAKRFVETGVLLLFQGIA